MDRIHAPCRCGNTHWDHFESSSAPGFTNVSRCRCGRQYSQPKSGLWYEITTDGHALLFMKRNALGRWTKATDKEIANHTLEPIDTKGAEGSV